ncbi:hypothetical protein JD969_17645 [Planctomycetota bacterium]|nr:hypothetical protein JD969_17645 [Planctomycetota bacterium]
MNNISKKYAFYYVAIFIVALGVTATFAYSQQETKSKADKKDRNRREMVNREGDPRARFGDMRARMMDRFREMLEFEEEEWELIQPYIENVTQLKSQISNRQGRMAGMTGRGGRGMRTAESSSTKAEKTPMQKASEKLRTLIDNPQASVESMQSALANYRQVREALESELALAQKDLKDLLTIKQEAQMVMFGILD